jgi:hypothetical protein
MNHEHDCRPAPFVDHLQSALEASCATLITLESLHACASSGCVDGDGLAMKEAIASLREAICELRAGKAEASVVSLGFVLGGRRRPSLPGAA